MEIKAIERTNVGQTVFDQLQNMIIRGEWKSGDKIPSENELAVMFQVSRMTVRQALQKLAALQLIETKVGEGSFVRKPEVGDGIKALVPMLCLDKDSNLQIFEFREIIDTEAVGLAVQRATSEDIKDLEGILKEMKISAEKKDYHLFAVNDLEFHFKISQMTRNNLLIQTNLILKRVLMASMDDAIIKMGCEPGIYYHTEILQAMKNKDKDKTMKLMREHIRANKSYFD